MSHLTTILAATDFLAPARHAADRAARLAHETGARLTLMHAVSGSALAELRQWLGAGHTGERQVIDEATASLQALAEELAASRHVVVHPHLTTGATVDCIGQHADALDADLLVLGARDSGFLRRPALGTTSERLLRRTTQRLHAAAHDAGLKPGHWDARVLEGEASRRILEQEQVSDCDLVVLGKHGRSAAEELLLGSVTKHVLAEGGADLLVSTARAGA